MSFVITSYAIFAIFFTAIGCGLVLGAPEGLTSLLQVISAWSSSFAFIILFNRIYPGLRLRDFVRQSFSARLRPSVLAAMIGMQLVIAVVAMILVPAAAGMGGLALVFPGLGVVLLAFVDELVRGPLGEELGWRRYALNELQKRYSPLRSALIVGLLWGFWHTPIWFASGYGGLDLVRYIGLFMIGILSFSVILTLFYNLNKNLLIPIIAHQLFNFLLVLVEGELLDILTYVMPAYLIVAVIVIALNPEGALYTAGRRNVANREADD